MINLNLAANNDQEGIVKKYLEENVSEILANKINNGNKTLSGFFKYAASEAKSRAINNCACISDIEVFGWAIHYFEEDNIEEDSVKEGQAIVKAKAPSEKKKQEKENAPKKQDNQQTSFFELLGGDI